MTQPFSGLVPVSRKELTHMLRDRGTLFFALFIPVLQLLMFGFAIDTNIRQIPTVAFDQSLTQESRRLLDSLTASDSFKMVGTARSEEEVYDMIRAGKARAAVKVPFDYSTRLVAGDTATVLLLVDGSDSTITSYAINAANGVAFQQSLRSALAASGSRVPIEVRPSVLYNPGTRSPNFFVPGMIALVLQMMIIVLVALSIVRERERGTLEQLTMTPVAPLGLMVGKMIPYGVLGFLELCTILAIMRVVFQVPINGNLLLLLSMSLPFLLTVLGLGLVISTRAKTQAEAFQMAVGTVLPSVFLSGYIFLIENMPVVFQYLSRIIPATYYIRILRGIILRGAEFHDLWGSAAALTLMGCAATLIAARNFVRNRG